ncbi:MAG: hypothetical protein IPM54_37065 [Polyangiaceae bacterium]|nr:hypothetical protein [Polyangiaceae bacterium]
MQMKTARIFLLVTFVVVLIPGCRPREKGKNRFDDVDGGAPPAREECTVQALDCFSKCAKREASPVCIGCCRDQDYLCDMQHKYSFDHCDGTR